MRVKGKLQRLLVLSAFFVLNAVLFGCQSTKVAQNVVEPYALLNENSVLYIKMPVKDNKEMFFKIFDSRFTFSVIYICHSTYKMQWI